MKVTLPDGTELELPDGATGLDAARAIGPKLAEQAVLVRVERERPGPPRCRSRTAAIQILTTRDRHDPDALYVLRHSAAHLLAEAARRLYPGTKVAIGPPIENGFYYDFEFPEPIGEEDLERLEDGDRREIAEGRTGSAGRSAATRRGATSRRRASPTRSSSWTPRKATSPSTARATSPTSAAGPHLQDATPIKAVKLTSLAGAYWRGDENNHAADPDLRHGVLRPGDLDEHLAAARGGEERGTTGGSAASSTSSISTSTRPARRSGIQRDGDLEHPRGPPPPRERGARLSRGEDAAALRHRALGDLGPLGEVPRQHVPDPAGGEDVRRSSR